jgi:hypothetical protein
MHRWRVTTKNIFGDNDKSAIQPIKRVEKRHPANMTKDFKQNICMRNQEQTQFTCL